MAEDPPKVQLDAASSGDPDAQCEVGIWYASNAGAQNAERARAWFLRARQQGSPRGSHNLGVLEQSTNQRTALKHFSDAAKAGYVPSMRALGYLLLEQGKGWRARMWLKKAAEHGDGPSKFALAREYMGSKFRSKQKLCFKLATEAANEGIVEAQALLATTFHEGIGTERSPSDAAYWWKRAAFNNHPGAQAMLGVAYHVGIVFERDIVQAAQWIIRSARQGNQIGIIYWDDIEKELTDEQYEKAKALAAIPLASEDA